MENTLVIIKPDGVLKNLLPEILKRFYEVGLKACAFKVRTLDEELIKEHYSHLLTRPFYPNLETFMMSGPVITMIVSGENAVSKVRELVGPTNSKNAPKGTIRGDFGEDGMKNIIHASDSVENGLIEINRFYKKEIKEMCFDKQIIKKR